MQVASINIDEEVTVQGLHNLKGFVYLCVSLYMCKYITYYVNVQHYDASVSVMNQCGSKVSVGPVRNRKR